METIDHLGQNMDFAVSAASPKPIGMKKKMLTATFVTENETLPKRF